LSSRLAAGSRVHLLDTTMLYSPDGGGVVRYLLAKRRWLHRHTRVRHSLLVPGERNGVGVNGETFIRCRALPVLRSRVPFDTREWSRAIVGYRPDVVEVGDPGPLAIAAFRARREGAFPVVAFCHTDLERDACVRYGRVAARSVAIYARSVFGHADCVLTPSEYMRRRLDEWGVAGVSVCPLGVDCDVFHPARRASALRKTLDLPAHARLCIFAGRFAPAKNIRVLVDAFRLLGDPYHLLLVGSGADVPRLPRNVTTLGFEYDARRLAALIGGAWLLFEILRQNGL